MSEHLVSADAPRLPRTQRRARRSPATNAPLPATLFDCDPNDPDTFPDQWAARVDGDCMVPLIPHGGLCVFDKAAKLEVGKPVAIFQKAEFVKPGRNQIVVKRLATAIPPWVKWPYQDHPDSTVLAIFLAEALNPSRTFTWRCADVLAVHACVGVQVEE